MIKIRAALLLSALMLTQGCQSVFTSYGAGNVSRVINPASYQCDGGQILNAGVVEPQVRDCAAPTRLYPQLVSPAADRPTMTHRWWGSVAFHGEMTTGNTAQAGYITPDPITARISERGARLLGIPSGLRTGDKEYAYRIPEPYREVFDGMAVGNSAGNQLQAYLKDFSDGSVTVQWRSDATPVMEATFVHGSPYVYFTALDGELILRTHAANGDQKGIFHRGENTLGLWTDVAGNRHYFLLVGDESTRFSGVAGNEIRAGHGKQLTVALLPLSKGTPDEAMIRTFTDHGRQRVDEVRIDYAVNRRNNQVTVTHQYRFNGDSVTTLAGMLPLHWKNSTQTATDYQVRSARGLTRFAATDQFSYTLPFVGVLPFFPAGIGDYDPAQLRALITGFVNQGPAQWNTHKDTYWTGKMLGRAAELAAIARDHDMVAEADQLIDWLKREMEDWFRADTSGELDSSKYFVYDQDWNTLLGFNESFFAHQQLNDHHFHYGYFVRAAAEVCRVEPDWCSARQYGPMVELLIRDYAAGRDDPLFPYLRNFDPAYGFSWASGNANFVLGNNNESTSEAANAYGAIILYGLITGQQALVDRGIYLHASSTATYWEYWNNIDRHTGKGADYDNFPPEYTKPTTSIIWGNGHVFTTWFSEAYAHILGIQGLPLSPLVLHIGQHADYLKDYVTLGLSESSNGKPSGLPANQWPDVWWNIWAMTDGAAAAADFASRAFDYHPEDGETKAHTYHWIHTYKQLGHVATGTDELTASSPTAVAFDKDGLMTYIAYNVHCAPTQVTFSDGMVLTVPGNSFRIKTSDQAPDSAPAPATCAVSGQ
ncbi:glycosyl hydrolase [Cellvibrio sp. ARAG 10.3]|uniref:glycosyl hydrolase n=1 Tax=Cellvibrio sp. ARAG 10.3 TaxID=3451358 RepID=UPI003F447E2B